jgi:hypothetical protein
MDKVIKEFKINNSDNEDLAYNLGYYLWDNKVYPQIEIYKNGKILSGGYWSTRAYEGLFHFFAAYSSSRSDGAFGCRINEMFIWLRKHSDIPEYIEKEYEEIFIIYKLNDFNEI